MINTKTLLNNKEDKHLNVFWHYEGKPNLENNITKAFINTIESLNKKDKIILFNNLFSVPLKNYEYEYVYYLQTSPEDETIKRINKNNRLLVAFSPTGKPWKFLGIDLNNKKEIEKSIKSSLEQLNLDGDKIKEETNKQLEEVLDLIDRGESVPDGWIVVYRNNKPEYCIAFENKLYDLDPFQLRNHCEKSLFLRKNNIKYITYQALLEEISNLNGYLVDDFLRYMYFLEYWKIDRVKQLEDMPLEYVEKYSKNLCIEILKDVAGSRNVSHQKGWIDKIDTNNNLNKMIGLRFNNEIKAFEMILALGTNQTISKSLYSYLKDNKTIVTKYCFSKSFHFQSPTSKNIGDTYCEGCHNVGKYIDFWIDNIHKLKQMDKKQRSQILDEMYKCKTISKKDYLKVKSASNNYAKKWNIVPELTIFLRWDLYDAIELDKKGLFISDIKKQLNEIYKDFDIEERF